MTTKADPEYAGFLSYRRIVPDQQWAKWLHRQLESFRLPRELVADLHSIAYNLE